MFHAWGSATHARLNLLKHITSPTHRILSKHGAKYHVTVAPCRCRCRCVVVVSQTCACPPYQSACLGLGSAAGRQRTRCGPAAPRYTANRGVRAPEWRSRARPAAPRYTANRGVRAPDLQPLATPRIVAFAQMHGVSRECAWKHDACKDADAGNQTSWSTGLTPVASSGAL